MNKIKKVLSFEAKQVGTEGDRTLRFVGSDESIDRDNDVIEVAGWKLDDYLKNPVFLWAHDYDEPPIGKAVNVTIDAVAKKLLFDVKFPTAEEYPFADTIYKLYKGGYLSATSVGFRGIKSKTRDDELVLEMPEWQRGKRYMEQELLELSAVPVPSNPNALQMAKGAGINIEVVEKAFQETKTVIPYKKYSLADESTVWDGPAEIAAAEVGDLKLMCAWYDEESPDVKQSYKLPHHTQADKNTVWRGVAAAMGALLGSRGGVDIPEDDRKDVYEHLKRHYADFEKEPPEFKSYTEVELKAIFETETKKADLEGNPSVSDIYDALWTAINPAEIYMRGGPYVENLYPIRYPSGNVIIEKMDKYYLYQYEFKDGIATLTSEGVELDEVYVPKSYKHKTGATISAKNREILNSIHVGMDENLKKLKGFIDTAMPMMGPDGMPMMEPIMTAQMTAPVMTANMTADMTAGMTMTMPMMEPMMSAMRTAEITEIKQALDELKSQVLILCQKTDVQEVAKQLYELQKVTPDATKAEIDLDAIEFPKPVKDPTDIELNIEPGELKTMIEETVKNLIQGGK